MRSQICELSHETVLRKCYEIWEVTVIVDTGVLVALIDPDTAEHSWAEEQAKSLPAPFLTSEPVLTEAAFLLAREGFDADELFELTETGLVLVGVDFNSERK